MSGDLSLDSLKGIVLDHFPELAGARFSLLTEGWDCIAVDADDRLIFKFPRHEVAYKGLQREYHLLQAIRPNVEMRVPDLQLIEGPTLFSRHEKIPGEHLLAEHYEKLDGPSRDALAAAMARFFADLHRLDRETMCKAGALPIGAWFEPEMIAAKAMPLLTGSYRDFATETLAAWQALPADPHGETYGFFDGHGWNMAFDHESHRLNGVYDFGDSGFGPLHQEFVYPSLVSGDLTARIIDHYEPLAGRSIDRGRVRLLTGVHKLYELAECAEDDKYRDQTLAGVTDWADRL
jgi:aminoglycoside phosphotransferase (APT) family kinase protein